MIVKGDGSLVRADWAMSRPIETILSGPAASVVGTWHLAGRRNVWVVDVGGTTTDIAVLRDGRPRINPEGAHVGGWRTMVEAADVHTVGLGGDSHVRLNGGSMWGPNGLTVGPRRVVPLCLLASQFPQVIEELALQLETRDRMGLSGQFVVAHRANGVPVSQADQEVLDVLAQGPRSLPWLVDQLSHGRLLLRQVEDMARRQLVRYAAFTPTDALHVLGEFETWNRRAAHIGAELMATQVAMPVTDFCQSVVAAVSDRVAAELVTKVLADEASVPDWKCEPAALALLARAMGGVTDSDLGCRLSLRQPVVAVGAPVRAYLPRTAEHLDTELIIPSHAEVANAVGAVAGSVVQTLQALIRPMEAESYFRVHISDGVHDFASLQEAGAYVEKVIPPRVVSMAREAGASHIEVQIEREDRTTPLEVEWGQEVYLETVFTIRAVGRPAL
jgi:N-methylhydantoinase A/oxoprolinase/acetone carboxylase beta subunit